MLELASQRGWSRDVDASMGLILASFEPGEPAVIPGFPEGTGPSEKLEVPSVTRASIPPAGMGMLPLRIEVEARHATPNWKLFGFALARETPERIVLTPFSQPPPADSLQAQVIDGFRCEALLQGLEPGRYELAVHGAEPPEQRMPFQVVEILPGRIWVRLETSSGALSAGVRVEVFKPGLVRSTPDGAEPRAPRHLWPEEVERLQELVAELPGEARSVETAASELPAGRLGWWTGVEWRTIALAEASERGPCGELVAFLRGLWAR
jgi:hypothetical protein